MKPKSTAKLSLARSTLTATASSSLVRPSLLSLSSLSSSSSSPSPSSFSSCSPVSSTSSRLLYCPPPSCLRLRRHSPAVSNLDPSISISGFSRTTHSSSSTNSSPFPSTAPRPTRSERLREMAPKTKFELKTPKGTKDCKCALSSVFFYLKKNPPSSSPDIILRGGKGYGHP